MELLQSIAFIVLGGVGGAGVIWLFYQFGGKVPVSFLNPFKTPGEESPKKIDVEVIPENKQDQPKENESAKVLKEKGDQLKKKLKLLALLSLSSLLLTTNKVNASSDGLIDNYVDTTYNYAVEVGSEFNSLRNDVRKDTKVVDKGTGQNTRTVIIQIPVREPIIKEDPQTKLMRIEFNDKQPIERTVKVTCTDIGPRVTTTGARFWFAPQVGLMASFSSTKTFEPQGSLFLNFLHWSNEYMNVSLSVFSGYKRYGMGISVGPSLQLSNIRLNVGYSREYRSLSEHYIEVGVGSLLYLN